MAKMEVVPPTPPVLKQRYKGIWKIFFVLTIILSAIWLIKSFTSGELADQSIMHGTEKALESIYPPKKGKMKITTGEGNAALSHVHINATFGNHTTQENISLHKIAQMEKKNDTQNNYTISIASKNESKMDTIK